LATDAASSKKNEWYFARRKFLSNREHGIAANIHVKDGKIGTDDIDDFDGVSMAEEFPADVAE
jgi:hypothetical protein